MEKLKPVEQSTWANFVYKALLILTYPLFKLIFSYQVRRETVPSKGPILVLANHQSYIDSLAAAYAFPKHKFNFVAGKALFHWRFLGSLLRTIQAIPKEQFYPDPSTIVNIVRIVKAGGSCILFPEGQRSYTGAPLPFSLSIVKLMKKLKVPVYTLEMAGCGLALPRWASNLRRGPIEAKVDFFMSPEELLEKSTEEIYQQLSERLKFSEGEWLKENSFQQRYRSRSLAKGVERILYYCPACQSELGFQSARKKFTCRACQAEYLMDEHYRITSDYDNPELHEDWSELQIARMADTLNSDKILELELKYGILERETRDCASYQTAVLHIGLEKIYLMPSGIELKTSKDGTAYVSLGHYVQLFGEDGEVYRLTTEAAGVAKIVHALAYRSRHNRDK
ncbi:MAG: lysophospholipid acyltransferase family protein [Eubacteriales bacterium]|nr:lysophospholipid acyltransferase family protein [Eubacteriales bacterium]